jgi:hypothetical protein
MKVRLVGAESFQADGRMDRNDEANTSYNFADAPAIEIALILIVNIVIWMTITTLQKNGPSRFFFQAVMHLSCIQEKFEPPLGSLIYRLRLLLIFLSAYK